MTQPKEVIFYNHRKPSASSIIFLFLLMVVAIPLYFLQLLVVSLVLGVLICLLLFLLVYNYVKGADKVVVSSQTISLYRSNGQQILSTDLSEVGLYQHTDATFTIQHHQKLYPLDLELKSSAFVQLVGQKQIQPKPKKQMGNSGLQSILDLLTSF